MGTSRAPAPGGAASPFTIPITPTQHCDSCARWTPPWDDGTTGPWDDWTAGPCGDRAACGRQSGASRDADRPGPSRGSPVTAGSARPETVGRRRCHSHRGGGGRCLRDAPTGRRCHDCTRPVGRHPAVRQHKRGLGRPLLQRWPDRADHHGAERALRRAAELNPNDPHARHHLANYNRVTGQLAGAIAARTRSLELAPLNPRTQITLGKDYLVAGNDSAALRHYQRASQLDALNPLGLGWGPSLSIGVAEIFLRRGNESESVTEYLRVAALRGATTAELESLRAGHAPATRQLE